jgi:hypothetical protein
MKRRQVKQDNDVPATTIRNQGLDSPHAWPRIRALCPDMDVVEDFDRDEPERIFFGDVQLNWIKDQLMKPADLTFVAKPTSL